MHHVVDIVDTNTFVSRKVKAKLLKRGKIKWKRKKMKETKK